MKSKNIIVNATALDKSGALTILNQFIAKIPKDENTYWIFISNKISLSYEQSNVNFIQVSHVKSLLTRVYWDYFGLKSWLRKHNIYSDVNLSLQNTGFRTNRKAQNYIYYHQPIVFYRYNWNLLKKQERVLWFYKNIYPFFIRLSITNKTKFFVQIPFIKAGIKEKFNIALDNIYIISPTLKFPKEPNQNNNGQSNLDENKINLFYPATSHFYKNHQLLFDALAQINDNRYVLYLTAEKTDFEALPNNIEVSFLGNIPWEKMQYFYKNLDALLFPSYIESYGLPLIESALFGMPIIASNLPYAREVLEKYKGVKYCDHTNVAEWIQAIKSIKKEKFEPYSHRHNQSWETLFDIIKS